jgi:hypothetical protein
MAEFGADQGDAGAGQVNFGPGGAGPGGAEPGGPGPGGTGPDAGDATGTEAAGPDGDLPLELRERLYRQIPFAIPGIAVVPVVLGIILATTLAPGRAGPAALGAAGWVVALALRTPAALAASRLPGWKKKKTPGFMTTFMSAISGPAEESVRLLMVLFLVKGFGSLLWAGFGWGTVEVVYTLVNAVVIRRLLLEPGEKAAEGRRALASMGFLQYVQNMVPVLGAVERGAVTLLHTGFTLLLGWNPWLVFVTMPAHSAINLSAMRLVRRRSVILMEAMVVVASAACFILGLLAWHR